MVTINEHDARTIAEKLDRLDWRLAQVTDQLVRIAEASEKVAKHVGFLVQRMQGLA